MTPIRKISGRLQSGLPIESVTIMLQTDAIARVQVKHVKKSSRKVRPILDSEVISDMRAAQEKRFRGVTEPDEMLTMEDGSGNTIEVKGFFVAPAKEASQGSNNEQTAIVGVDALLNSLDLSVYRSDVIFNNMDAARLETEAPQLGAGNISGALSEITKALMDTIQRAKDEETREKMKEVIDVTHANNKIAVAPWHAILNNSQEETIPALRKLLRGDTSYNTKRTIVELTTQVMQQQAGSFWNAVMALMEHFKLTYIPGTSGSGKFIRRDLRVGADTTQTIKLGATQTSFNDGSSTVLQLGGVVMLGPSANYAQRLEGQKSGSVVATYPETFGAGYIHQIQVPAWLPEPSTLVDTPQRTRRAPLKNYDIDALIKEINTLESKASDIDDSYEEIFRDLCRVSYDEIQLSSSRGTIVMPLNFSPRIGERTKFEAADGASFTGFIDSIQHSVILSEGSQLSSSTTISVTHVRF